jgi:ribosomal protein S18 acetylase RimI-like enzyme
VTLGDPQALGALLAAAWSEHDLPPAIYAAVREEHLPVVSQYYDLTADRRPMLRMHLVDMEAATGSHRHELPPVTRLSGADTGAVLRLLAEGGPFAPDAFAPAQIDAGVFFGVYSGTELLAVGGTHVVDYTQGIGAIGNMYTHPGCRRRGFSAVILRSVVGELLARGVTQIVLNVDQRNTGAQALYLAHGFVVHVPYFEGKGSRNVVRVPKEKQTL